MGQDSVHVTVGRPSPSRLTLSTVHWKFKAVLQKPHQCLPDRTDLEKLTKHQQDRLLDPSIRIFFQPLLLCLDKSAGRRDDQFPSSCLLPPRFPGTLSQQVQLVFVQTPFYAQQQPVITLPRGIHGLLVNQHRIDNTANFDQLLPLPAVARETRYFPGSNRSDLP